MERPLIVLCVFTTLLLWTSGCSTSDEPDRPLYWQPARELAPRETKRETVKREADAARREADRRSDLRRVERDREWAAKLEVLAHSLTSEARLLLNETELEAILKGPPRPGYGVDPERLRIRNEAMFRVVEHDPRWLAAMDAFVQKCDSLAEQYHASDPSAETIADALVPRLTAEIAAFTNAHNLVFEENGWVNDIEPRIEEAFRDGARRRLIMAVMDIRARVDNAGGS